MLLGVAVGALAAESSYKIEFKKSGTSADGTNITTALWNANTTITPAGYVTGYTGTSGTVQLACKGGMRLGAKGTAGKITLNLSEDAMVIPTKIVVMASRYNSGDTKAALKVNDKSGDVPEPEGAITYSGFTEAISSIALETSGTQKRALIASIEVFYEAGDETSVKKPIISNNGNEVSITCATEGASIVYSYKKDNVDVVTNQAYTTPFTVEGYGSFDVTAIASKEGLESSTNSYNFVIEAPLTLAEFLSQKPTTDKEIAGPLQTIYQSGKYTYIQDAQGTNALVYEDGTSVVTGKFANQTVISSLTGSYKAYRNLPEIIPTAIGTTTEATTQIEPTVATAEDITTDNLSKYYIVKGGTLSSDAKKMTVGETEITLYNQFGITLPTVNTAANYDVTGFVGCYNTGVQFYPIAFKEVKAQYDFNDAYTFENITLDVNEMQEIVLPEVAPDVTYTSSDTEVADVDGNHILAYKAGTATITAKWDETEDWLAGEATFTVTVVKNPELTILEENIDKELGCEPFEIEYASETPVTAESSNTAVATVAPVEGKDAVLVTVTGAGEAVITFTAAATGEYREATHTVTIKVTDPNAKSASFDFTNPTSLGITPSTDSNETSVSGQTIIVGGISITFDKGDANNECRIWKKNDTYDLRVYTGSKFTIASPDKTEITKITFGVNDSKFSITPDEGSITDYVWTNTTASTSAPMRVAAEGTNEVVFSVGGTTQLKSVDVEYANSNTTGIADVNANENAPVEYFNLQGVRVENPQNGLYIRRQGSVVTKVIVK